MICSGLEALRSCLHRFLKGGRRVRVGVRVGVRLRFGG